MTDPGILERQGSARRAKDGGAGRVWSSDVGGTSATNTTRWMPLVRGRGAIANIAGRFESQIVAPFDDGWGHDDDDVPSQFATQVTHEVSKSILTRNNSPDLPFRVSLNPYRGCEHGCVYCYARPSHSYLGLSPGLDFETRLFAKVNAAELLTRELAKPNYLPEVIAVGVNTDAYQPVERELRITRGVIEVLHRARHPFTLITKSSLIERDVDLLADMSRDDLVSVSITITTLDTRLARKLEPRATSPTRRLRIIRELSQAGIPVSVSVSPIIPFINDSDMEAILDAAADAGAQRAHFIMLRLPNELREVFRMWLAQHFPDRAERVMRRIQDMRGGRDNDSRFGWRMRGQGIWYELYRQRFHHRSKRLGLTGERRVLDVSKFMPPQNQLRAREQLALFD